MTNFEAWVKRCKDTNITLVTMESKDNIKLIMSYREYPSPNKYYYFRETYYHVWKDDNWKTYKDYYTAYKMWEKA